MAGEDAAKGVILTWNVTNWITVVLMAAIAFFLLGLAQKYYQSRNSEE